MLSKITAAATVAVLSIGVVACSNSDTTNASIDGAASERMEKKNKDVDAYVVKFHADWCGSCKAIAPLYTFLSNDYAGESVSFVKLDLTNEETKAKAIAKMKELGMSNIFEKHGEKTGFMLLVDPDNNGVISKFTKNTKTDEAKTTIDGVLDS